MTPCTRKLYLNLRDYSRDRELGRRDYLAASLMRCVWCTWGGAVRDGEDARVMIYTINMFVSNGPFSSTMSRDGQSTGTSRPSRVLTLAAKHNPSSLASVKVNYWNFAAGQVMKVPSLDICVQSNGRECWFVLKCFFFQLPKVGVAGRCLRGGTYYQKIQTHSRCEIEDFIDYHIYKLCAHICRLYSCHTMDTTVYYLV